MRHLIQFPCGGETLVGTWDDGHASTGLLIVSGGNEIRIGAHRGMAELAGHVAAAGHPVLRYDRRGIGDSSGENKGFEGGFEDLREAVAAFRRAVPGLTRIAAYGNCDAASSLALYHHAVGIDALILSNPWVIDSSDSDDALPPAAAIKSRYLAKLKDPREWLRLARGGVDLSKVLGGLRKISETKSAVSDSLSARMAAALDASTAPLTILLAQGDNTAIAFTDAWHRPEFASVRERARLVPRATASHSFAPVADKQWLTAQILNALRDDFSDGRPAQT